MRPVEWSIAVLSLGACYGSWGVDRCVDSDGDGLCAIDDCDDADSASGETCAPPGCADGCPSACAGSGCDESLRPGPGGALDAAGAVVVQAAAGALPHAIWLDDRRPDGLLTRADSRTLELGPRYRLPTGPGTMGAVAVDAFGDAYVPITSQSASTITKVRSSGCEDRNGDGVVATSSGFDDVLPLGDDECVAWTRELGSCPGCEEDAMSAAALTEGGNALWVSMGPVLYEVDAVTGGLTDRSVYLFWDEASSLVADADGGLWFLGEFALQRVELATLAQAISIYWGSDPGRVDFDSQGRIWLTYLGTLHRFVPFAEADEDTGIALRDFAIVDDGRAWGLSTDSLLDVDLERAEAESSAIEIDGSGLAPDLDGHVWASSSSDGEIVVHDASNGDRVAQPACAERDDGPCLLARLRGDPSGARFVRAFGGPEPRATAAHVFDTGCDGITDAWLHWQVGVAGHVHFEARSASSAAGLNGMPWVPLGSSPPAEGRGNLWSAFWRYGGSRLERVVEVRAELRGADAILERLELAAECGP